MPAFTQKASRLKQGVAIPDGLMPGTINTAASRILNCSKTSEIWSANLQNSRIMVFERVLNGSHLQ